MTDSSASRAWPIDPVSTTSAELMNVAESKPVAGNVVNETTAVLVRPKRRSSTGGSSGTGLRLIETASRGRLGAGQVVPFEDYAQVAQLGVIDTILETIAHLRDTFGPLADRSIGGTSRRRL